MEDFHFYVAVVIVFFNDACARVVFFDEFLNVSALSSVTWFCAARVSPVFIRYGYCPVREYVDFKIVFRGFELETVELAFFRCNIVVYVIDSVGRVFG